jgi:hypothetical protein
MRDTSLKRLTGERGREGIRRLVSEKRWHYAGAATERLFVGGAIVQLGYLANAFMYVFDRPARKMLVERSFLLPPQLVQIDDFAADARASMRWLRSRMLIAASAAEGHFFAELSGEVLVDLKLHTDKAPMPLTAVCPVVGGSVTMTQKTACVPAEGEVRIGGVTQRMEGALAALDFSHGLFARETRWRWASANGRLPDGRAIGLNLVEGHNDGEITENAMWIGEELSQPGHAKFELDESEPLRPWRVTTDDGRVDLRFTPEGARREDIDLKIIASQYVQPFGNFEGTIRDATGQEIRIAELPGVVERHRARW